MDRLINHQEHHEEDEDNTHYQFTAVVESMQAKVYYISKENFQLAFRYLGVDKIKRELSNRMALLQKQVNTITSVRQEQILKNKGKATMLSKTDEKQEKKVTNNAEIIAER